jgi:hypothetical protein
MNKTILNHPLVQILNEGAKYRVLISMSKGGQVEHEPFPGDQRGLVAAMSLATEVLAGKVWLSHSVAGPKRFELPEQVQI